VVDGVTGQLLENVTLPMFHGAIIMAGWSMPLATRSITRVCKAESGRWAVLPDFTDQ
jgi:hypothetical protein